MLLTNQFTRVGGWLLYELSEFERRMDFQWDALSLISCDSAWMPAIHNGKAKCGRSVASLPTLYSIARSLLKRLGDKMNVKTRLHDLRRPSATYASRKGILLEVIAKVTLRAQTLRARRSI